MGARVDATSPTARVAIEEMISLAVDNGAELHPSLFVRERDGQMSVHADASDGEPLIRLPVEVLVPIDDTVWETSGGRLSVAGPDHNATPMQQELAERLVAVYNATDKIRWAETTLPAIAFRNDPDATVAVQSLRPGFSAGSRSVADAFVRTRLFRWSRPNSTTDTAHEPGRRFLMPVIDLINHNELGAPYQLGSGAMTISVAHPGASTECVVRYGARRDPLDLAISHGYVERNATLARSVPVTVEAADDLLVHVRGTRLEVRSELDPPRISMERGRLTLSHATFEPGRPDRFVTFLRLAIAAYQAKYEIQSIDVEGISWEVTRRLAEANVDRLLMTQQQFARSASPAATIMIAAADEQRRIIEEVIESPR